uniref:Glucose/sorbosone dehydrogenase n=1 Tax=Acetithermum autotrophicum TaxID=1446466 RepID=H5SRL5_ACEAU|nr:glucose/sorbosone dehydrogenase [Candidatus Acetothermum autotrophicum]
MVKSKMVNRNARQRAVASLFVFILALTSACVISGQQPQPVDPCSVRFSVTIPQLELQKLVDGFTRPVYLTHAGDGSGRLFVVEQAGIIQIIRNGQTLATPFLDIRDRVESGGEKGLLSVAFHPKYKENGRFFVNYTARKEGVLKSVIAEYRVSSHPDVADRTERVILEIEQPFANHNGGLNKFGPDGFLYIGLGDGGAAGDPLNNAQSLDTLLGKILRIDIEKEPYAIPQGNPFVGRANAQGEIWAYGLRNPWRFSFDRCNGRLFAGDVGQNRLEEIDLIEKGKNYGWRIMEGSQCFDPPTLCNTLGLELPIAEYDHSLGCSVTGGYVYRGTQFPALIGHYLFGDYCSGRIWSLVQESSGKWTMRQLIDSPFSISSFGEDEQGELYVVHYGGAIYRVTAK